MCLLEGRWSRSIWHIPPFSFTRMNKNGRFQICSKTLRTCDDWSLMGKWLPLVCGTEQFFNSFWSEMVGRNFSYYCNFLGLAGEILLFVDLLFFSLRITQLYPSVRFFSTWVVVVPFCAKYGVLFWPIWGNVTSHTNTHISFEAKYHFTFQNLRRLYSSSPSDKAVRISEFSLHLCCWQLFSFLQYGEFGYEKSSFLKEILLNFVLIWFWGNKNSWVNEKGTRNIFL